MVHFSFIFFVTIGLFLTLPQIEATICDENDTDLQPVPNLYIVPYYNWIEGCLYHPLTSLSATQEDPTKPASYDSYCVIKVRLIIPSPGLPVYQTELGEIAIYIPDKLLGKCKAGRASDCLDILDLHGLSYFRRNRIFTIQVDTGRLCQTLKELAAEMVWEWIDLIPYTEVFF